MLLGVTPMLTTSPDRAIIPEDLSRVLDSAGPMVCGGQSTAVLVRSSSEDKPPKFERSAGDRLAT